MLNKNTIPFDPAPPMLASGVRVGTPAVTTQGMGVEQMQTIADLIAKAAAAQKAWAAQNPQKRARVLMRFVDLVNQNMQELAELLAGTVDHDKELILPWLADDRL